MDSLLDRKFAALADPTRRAIVARLARGEASVAELKRPFGISQPAISRHLKVLEQAEIIETTRAAQSRPRRLKPGALTDTSAWIDHLNALWPSALDRLDTLLTKESDPQ